MRAHGARAARVPPRRGGAVIETLREALAGERAWLVGGAVRDRLLGRPTPDLDLVVDGDVRRAARSLGRAPGGAAFELSDAVRRLARRRPATAAGRSTSRRCRAARSRPTSPRATSPSTRWPSRWPAASSSTRTAARADLAARRLRMVSAEAFAADPLRTLRVARLACELGFEVEPDDRGRGARARAGPGRLGPERVFAELKRIVVADAAVRRPRAHGRARPRGRRAARARRAARRRAEPLPPPRRARPHARGARRPASPSSATRPRRSATSLAAPVRALLAEPLADGLTRGGGLRFGALLHDAAKPQTRAELPDGRIGFPGHDAQGAALARAVLAACAPASACARTSPRSRATTCASASSSTRRRSTAATVYRYLRDDRAGRRPT